MDPVYRTESNVIHFRLSSPQRFVVACFATTAAFGLIILLVESKMNWNWTGIPESYPSPACRLQFRAKFARAAQHTGEMAGAACVAGRSGARGAIRALPSGLPAPA